MEKAVYRLAGGHQILEREGDLGRLLPKKERIGLYSLFFAEGPRLLPGM